MKKFLMTASAVALAMTAQVASAASFNFSFAGTTNETSDLVSGMGTLWTSDTGLVDGATTFYEIVDATGTINLSGYSNVGFTAPATIDLGTDPDTNLPVQSVNFIALTNGVYSLAQFGLVFPSANPTNLALFTGTTASLVVDGADLTISDTGFQISAIPEPATWGMMLVGFGMIGATVRRRRVTFANA